jgi:hypothetical protein
VSEHKKSKKKNRETSINVGGSNAVGKFNISGDFVSGNKTSVSSGNIVIGGNISDSKIVTGDDSLKEGFSELLKLVEESNLMPEDKNDIKATLQELEDIFSSKEKNDEILISRRLRFVSRLAPDLAERLLSVITNPVYSFSTIARKIAEKAFSSENY